MQKKLLKGSVGALNGEEQHRWHGFESREKAMYEWEEFNSAHPDSPVALVIEALELSFVVKVDFMNAQRQEHGLEPMPDEGTRVILMAKVREV